MMGRQIQESAVVSASCQASFINLSASSTLREIGRRPWQKAAFVIRLLREVRRELRRCKPDLVYVTPTSTLPGFIKDYLVVRLVRKAGVRVVVHFHNKGVSSRQDRWLDDRLYRSFFKGTDVILLSRSLYPDVRKYVPENRLHICPNGIPDLPHVRVEHTGFRFLFLSNLIPTKGILVLLEACRVLKEKGRRFQCEFVGAGTVGMEADKFVEIIRSMGLEGMVVYSGPCYGEEKVKALARSDAFVFPTFYPYECFPLVLLEALSMELPVITTREGAIQDIVEDGVDGILCQQQDLSGLVRAMEYLLDHPDKAREMGSKGRERFLGQFTSRCFESNLLSILQKLI